MADRRDRRIRNREAENRRRSGNQATGRLQPVWEEEEFEDVEIPLEPEDDSTSDSNGDSLLENDNQTNSRHSNSNSFCSAPYYQAISKVNRLGGQFQDIELKYLIGAIHRNMSEDHADFALRLFRSEGLVCVRCFKTLINKLAKLSFDSKRYLICKYSINDSTCNRTMVEQQRSFRCQNCGSAANNKQPYLSFDVATQIQIISTFTEIDQLPPPGETLEIGVYITCDGILLTDSSKNDLYPVLVYINNFNNIQVRARNFVIASAYLVKKGHPVNYEQLFHPLIQQLNELRSFATDWAIRCRVQVLGFLADSPCRSAILKMTQYNGRFPCHRCKINATSVVIQRTNRPDRRQIKVPILLSTELYWRRVDQVVEQGQRMERHSRPGQNQVTIQGVKGVSILSHFDFDFIAQTPMEVMHCLFLGVTRSLINFYFSFPRVSLLDQTRTRRVNRRINHFHFLKKVSRQIRSFDERKNFKSSEFQNILFFGSYFLFKDLLSNILFKELMLLSQGTMRLYFDGYNRDELEKGRLMIDKFLHSIRNGRNENRFRLFNFHALAHLYEDRTRHGPLYSISAYPYENQLQLFKKELNV